MLYLFGYCHNLVPILLYDKRYTAILEEIKKNPESHGGPPDCIVRFVFNPLTILNQIRYRASRLML